MVAEKLELVLADGRRVALAEGATIGRAPGSTIQIPDPSVSRQHARIARADDGRLLLEDAGSTYGTWVDGRRATGRVELHDGTTIALGDVELRVERTRRASEAGLTLVVPADATSPGPHPHLRPGFALKRLEASEGERRWVLRDLGSDRFVRMSGADAELLRLLDGRRPLPELVAEAARRQGEHGPARLARLLAELGERGLLAGVEGEQAADGARGGRVRRLMTPRFWTWPGAGETFDRLYRGGGRVLLTRPALMAIAAVALAGLVVFPWLTIARYGTPFVVAQRVGFGALVFLVGRFALVALHETAHGLVMRHYGRRVDRAGVKIVGIFPYAFVDTSEAWFEPRRRRIAISGAGPVSDFTAGAGFALCCLATPAGSLRDVFFQLSFGAYLGGCLNLNPFVERDGYHVLVDVLREPGLRKRARSQLARRLAGAAGADESRVLGRYAVFGFAWSVFTAGLATVVMAGRVHMVAATAPPEAVWAVAASSCALLLLPTLALVTVSLRARRRLRRSSA